MALESLEFWTGSVIGWTWRWNQTWYKLQILCWFRICIWLSVASCCNRSNRRFCEKHRKIRDHLTYLKSKYIIFLDLILFINFSKSNIIYIRFENNNWFLIFWRFSRFFRVALSLRLNHDQWWVAEVEQHNFNLAKVHFSDFKPVKIAFPVIFKLWRAILTTFGHLGSNLRPDMDSAQNSALISSLKFRKISFLILKVPHYVYFKGSPELERFSPWAMGNVF